MTEKRFSDNKQLAALVGTEILVGTSTAGGAATPSGTVAADEDIKATTAQLRDWMLDDDSTMAADSSEHAPTQAAVKQHVADAIAALTPNSASIGVQFLADTAATTDADPGAGNIRWNHATQASATVLFLDDASTDGAALTGFWSAMEAGGFVYLQHATDQDTWQIWEVTNVNDAAGYAKLTVALIADGGAFADNDPMLVTIEQGQLGGGVLTIAGLTTTQTVTSSATVTPVANQDKVVISAQAAALTIANPSGTPAEGQGFVIALKDNGTARGITFGAGYRPMGAALPTTTVLGKWMYIPVMYNATDAKWDVFAVSQQA